MRSMRFFICLFLLLPFLSAPLYAQDAAVAQKVEEALKASETRLSDDQLKLLIGTIENQAEREAFLAKLKALQAAVPSPRKPEDARAPSVQALDSLSNAVSGASQNLALLLRGFADLPQAQRWIERQLQTEETRQNWLKTILQAALCLFAGFAAQALVRFVTLQPRRKLAALEGLGLAQKVFVMLGHHILALLPVLAFAMAALFTHSALEFTPKAGPAVVDFLRGFMGLQLAMWLLQIILAERAPRLRLLPLADESAAYIYVWCARLAGFIIFSFFLSQAALALDVPKGSVHAFSALMGFIIMLMAVVIVLQNRSVVGDWLRGAADNASDRASFVMATRARLADVWHVLAIAYLGIGFLIAVLNIEQGFATLLRATVVSVITLAVFRFVLMGIDRLVARGFALPAELRRQFPRLEARTNSYLPLMERIMKGMVWIAALLIIVNAWGVDTSAWFASPLGRRVFSATLSIAFTLFVVVVLWEITSTLIERYLDAEDAEGQRIQRSARMRTLLPLVRYALHVLLVLVAGLVILSELGMDITPLLAGAGIIGLAVGFGAQTLVKDFITGLFILLEDTIAVGDVVDVGAHKGTVELMTIRTLRLRDAEGHVHSVPFSEVTSVINMTKNYAYVLVEVGVGYDSDLSRVMQVMKDVARTMQEDGAWRHSIYEPMEMLGVERFDASSIAVRARIKADGQKQWAIRREYLLRLKAAFDREGIEIPYPIVMNVHAAHRPSDQPLVDEEMKK